MVVNVDNLMLIAVEGPHYHRWMSTDMDAVMLAQEVPVSSRHHIQKLNFEVITILVPVSVAYAFHSGCIRLSQDLSSYAFECWCMCSYSCSYKHSPVRNI